MSLSKCEFVSLSRNTQSKQNTFNSIVFKVCDLALKLIIKSLIMISIMFHLYSHILTCDVKAQRPNV